MNRVTPIVEGFISPFYKQLDKIREPVGSQVGWDLERDGRGYLFSNTSAPIREKAQILPHICQTFFLLTNKFCQIIPSYLILDQIDSLLTQNLNIVH